MTLRRKLEITPRAWAIIVIVLAVGLAAMMACCARPMSQASPRPNIIFLLTDDQRWDAIGVMGNDIIQTPHLDRLANEGVLFPNNFCTTSICPVSRASFLTGMYPSSVHGSTNGNDVWADAAPLVPKLLADAGYDCGLAGKLHIAGAHGRIEPRGDDGYRVFKWSHDPQDQWPDGHAYREWLADQGHDLGEMRKDPAAIPPDLL